jgi:aryl-alcohol dehydrogenase-like predicted oxidoreductase
MQNHYNLLYREEEREMMPTLKLFGVGAIPWSPLARGVLARPAGAQTTRSAADPLIAGYGSLDVIREVETVAEKHGVSMAQVALAWLLSKPAVTAPIVGATKLKHIEDAVRAIHLVLDDEDVKLLESGYKARGVLGHG